MRSPLAYAWAAPWSFVGLVLSLFFERRRVVSGVLVCEGAEWPRRSGWSYSAITFGHVILTVTTATPALMRHELVHVQQYERWGPFFVPAYLVAAVWARARGGSAHADNTFEIAARNKSEGPSV